MKLKKILKSSYTNALKRIKNSNFNTVLSIQYTIINVLKKKIKRVNQLLMNAFYFVTSIKIS